MNLLPRLLLFFSLLLGTLTHVWAQDKLSSWNQQRLDKNKQAMYVLGGWAVGNMAVGAIGMARTSGEKRAFHQMNLGWNLVNLGLAASGIWNASHADATALDTWHSWKAHENTQRLFLFNAGLDAGYIMTGFWMQERGKNATQHTDRWTGFGKSLVLQGAFLMVFDLGAFLFHRPLDKQFPEWGGTRSSWHLSPASHSYGLALVYSFK